MTGVRASKERRGRPESSDSGGGALRFQLLRYYLATSLAVIAVITVVVAVLFVKAAERSFAETSAHSATMGAGHVAHLFYHGIWLPKQEQVGDPTLRDVVDPQALQAFAGQSTFGLNIVALSILGLDGSVLWSNTTGSVYNDDMGPFATVVHQGTPSSELRRDTILPGADGGERSMDVFRTLYPLRDVPLDAALEGMTVGVLQIDQDVTDDLAAARRQSLVYAVLGSIGMGTVLFTLLFLVVFRADRILGRGHQRLRAQQARLEGQIAERIRAEAALRRSEERFRTIFEFAPIGVAMVNGEGAIVQSNPAFGQMLGYTAAELDGTPFREVTHPDDLASNLTLFKQLLDGELDDYVFEKRYIRKDGSIAWGHMAVSRMPTTQVGFRGLAMVEDITERKQAEERLREASRLASIGELAAGVAHELNNPLTSVMVFSKLLMANGLSDEARSDTEKIYSEATRASKIVKSLLSFARRRELEMTYQSVEPVLGKALELKAYDFGASDVSVASDSVPDLPQTMLDEDLILEALLNILNNAHQAVLSASGPKRVSVQVKEASGNVRITVSDEGPGIPPEYLGKIFDPFFTTKQVGEGTGLGLSICYGIVQQHGGRLWVESEAGKGSSFHIDLPIVAPDSQSHRADTPTADQLEVASGVGTA